MKRKHREPERVVVEAIRVLAELDRRIDHARQLLGRCLPLRQDLANYIDLELQRQLAEQQKEH